MRNQGAYLWSMLGKIGPQVIYLIATMILARYLTPEDFGKVGVLAIFISIASTLNDAGLSGSLIKETTISKIDCSTINVYNICVSAVLYLLLFVMAPLIERFFDVEGLDWIVRCLGLVFLINSFSTVPRALMVRELRFQGLTIITFISVGVASIIAIIAAIKKSGAYSLVIYQLVTSTISTVAIIIVTQYRFSVKFSVQSFKKLFSFGFFTTITNIFDNVYENLLTFLFGKFLSVNQAGYLSQAKKLEDASISACKDTIGSVAFPILTRIRDEREDFWKEALSITKNVVLLILPCLLIVAVYSTEIITLAFGKRWEATSPYLSALMIAGFFMLVESSVRTFIKSLGNVGKLAKYTLVKRLVCVIIIILTALINPNMIILAYILGAAIGLYVNIILYCKILHKQTWVYLREIIKYSMPSLACCSICWVAYVVFPNFVISLSITILMALVYLFMLLPKFGLNIYHSIKRSK